MLQSENVVRENYGFVATPFVISYQILATTKFIRIHYIEQLQVEDRYTDLLDIIAY